MTRIFEDEKLRNRKRVFRDRADAGRRLGESFSRSTLPAAMVLAIPAGGVPIALEISRRLRLPMPEDTLRLLLPLADEIHCPNVRTSYPFAVADAYQNWYDLPDDEVVRLVEERG